MAQIRKEIEFTVRTANVPGMGAELRDALSRRGVELLAYASFPSGAVITVLFVTSDSRGAERTLQDEGFAYGSDAVVFADGMERATDVARLGRRLRAAGIGILYSYTSATRRAAAVLKTDDDDLAVQVLQGAEPAGSISNRNMEGLPLPAQVC